MATEPKPATGPGVEPPILGAVLVGGASRRMGFDKARIPFHGRPLAEHVASVLETVLAEVVLVTRRTGDARFPGRRQIADLRPGEGPLAGLHAALHAATGRAVFLAACDLPGLHGELIRHVLTAGDLPPEALGSGSHAFAHVPRFEGRLQPLAALYSAGCLAMVERCLDRGVREMHRLLDSIEVTEVPVTPELPFFHPRLLANLNRPEDLELYLTEESSDGLLAEGLGSSGPEDDTG